MKINYINKISDTIEALDQNIVKAFRLNKILGIDEYSGELFLNIYYKDKILKKCEELEIFTRALRDKLENN